MAQVTLLGSPASNTPGVTLQSTLTDYSAFTYTVSAGSDRLLCLFIGAGDTEFITAAAVTYGGQAGTQLALYLKNDGNYCLVDLWYWKEAAIAAAANTTFSITSWTVPATILDSLGVGAAAFAAVHQTTPFGTPVSASGTGTTPSTGSITVGTDELAIGSVCTDDDNAFSNASTVLFEIEGIQSDLGVGAQYRTTTGALTWTTDSQSWAAAGVVIKPAAVTSVDLSWMGHQIALRGPNIAVVSSGFDPGTGVT